MVDAYLRKHSVSQEWGQKNDDCSFSPENCPANLEIVANIDHTANKWWWKSPKFSRFSFLNSEFYPLYCKNIQKRHENINCFFFFVQNGYEKFRTASKPHRRFSYQRKKNTLKFFNSTWFGIQIIFYTGDRCFTRPS